jgi:hypothetical protein
MVMPAGKALERREELRLLAVRYADNEMEVRRRRASRRVVFPKMESSVGTAARGLPPFGFAQDRLRALRFDEGHGVKIVRLLVSQGRVVLAG